jgi:hypothetical protein
VAPDHRVQRLNARRKLRPGVLQVLESLGVPLLDQLLQIRNRILIDVVDARHHVGRNGLFLLLKMGRRLPIRLQLRAKLRNLLIEIRFRLLQLPRPSLADLFELDFEGLLLALDFPSLVVLQLLNRLVMRTLETRKSGTAGRLAAVFIPAFVFRSVLDLFVELTDTLFRLENRGFDRRKMSRKALDFFVPERESLLDAELKRLGLAI